MIEVFKKLGLQALSILLILFGTIGMFSLVSYNPFDPSWDFSTDAIIKNWGGVIGANLSSLYLTFCGLSGYFISIPSFVWGVKMMRYTMQGRDDEPSWIEKPSLRNIRC